MWTILFKKSIVYRFSMMQYLRCVHLSVLYFKGDIYLIMKWLVCIIRDLENQPKSQKYGNLKKLESLKEFFFYFHPLDLEFRIRVVLFRYGQIWVTRSMENCCRYHMSGSQQDTTMLFANTQYTNLKHDFETCQIIPCSRRSGWFPRLCWIRTCSQGRGSHSVILTFIKVWKFTDC